MIGVVLIGRLEDYTAGLQAVKECAGIVVVQVPGTAEAPEMPIFALDHVRVSHCESPEALGAVLLPLVLARWPH